MPSDIFQLVYLYNHSRVRAHEVQKNSQVQKQHLQLFIL